MPLRSGQACRNRIAAATPDAAAIAKVAIGPEHAIELPTDDPTASPILQLDEVAAQEYPFSVDESVPNEEPIVADAEADRSADETQTAAIMPYAVEPALDELPVKKPKRQRAEKAKPQAVDKPTEVASLPGVDVGGLAGHSADADDNSASTVRTVTKPARAGGNAGGVPAGAARVTTAVNLRTSPKKGSSVAAVVPNGSAVNVLSCDGWCEVVYNGKKGWVYKNFLASSKPISSRSSRRRPLPRRRANLPRRPRRARSSRPGSDGGCTDA